LRRARGEVRGLKISCRKRRGRIICLASVRKRQGLGLKEQREKKTHKSEENLTGPPVGCRGKMLVGEIKETKATGGRGRRLKVRSNIKRRENEMEGRWMRGKSSQNLGAGP